MFECDYTSRIIISSITSLYQCSAATLVRFTNVSNKLFCTYLYIRGSLIVAVNEANRRIKFAHHLAGWNYESGDRALLRKDGAKIIPSEYSSNMEGKIFCPACYTNLNRVPKEKDHFSNGREAYFAHLRAYTNVHCDLRSTKPEGRRYNTYEEAQKAIDDENLVIVSGFLKDRPQIQGGESGKYDETPVEDVDGPITEIPIARHSGESFKLPSKIETVMGICRRFDENLYKYYYFPGQSHAVRLNDLLHDVRRVTAEDKNPKLYYGVIQSSFNAGPSPRNIRMTKLVCHPSIKDFYLKSVDMEAQEKGIHDETTDRILIMYGTITNSGIGLSIEKLSWGEYALLPHKYDDLLLTVT